MVAGSRRQARERALSILYEAGAKGIAIADVLAAVAVEPDPFAVELVEGFAKHRERVDELIDRYAIGWELDRMPVLDLAVLRLAVFELLERPDVPIGATISEAVEMAKRYSTEESPKFVNGVLSAVATEVRPGT
jgi:N utilization substance protein B